MMVDDARYHEPAGGVHYVISAVVIGSSSVQNPLDEMVLNDNGLSRTRCRTGTVDNDSVNNQRSHSVMPFDSGGASLFAPKQDVEKAVQPLCLGLAQDLGG